MGGQHCERRGDILVLQQHPFGDTQMRRREVPDRAHPAGHQKVADLLRTFGGNGNDPDMDAHAPAKVGELFHGEDHRRILAVHRRRVGIAVECRDQTDAELRKAFIAEQRAAELACAHEHRFVDAVVAEEGFDIPDEPVGLEAGFRLARTRTDGGDVFAHLHLIKPQGCGDLRRGNVRRLFALQTFEVIEIHGKPQKRLSGDAPNARLRAAHKPYRPNQYSCIGFMIAQEIPLVNGNLLIF